MSDDAPDPDGTSRRVAAMGDGALTESALAGHVAPLFSRALARHPATSISPTIRSVVRSTRRRTTCAKDSPPGMRTWAARGTRGWPRCPAYRERIARMLGASPGDCVVPKTSAGQGLRAILNTFDSGVVPRVVATRGEFDSLDVILREYARRSRIALAFVEARGDGRFDTADILAAIGARVDLVVVSEVVFNTGQRLDDVGAIVARDACSRRAAAARRLSLAGRAARRRQRRYDVDFAVGGSYKYLRGGPGACFLYLHPRHLDGSLRTLDIGWFAKREPLRVRASRPAAARRGRRRVPRIDAAGHDVLSGARRPAARARTRRCAHARLFARAAAATGRTAGGARASTRAAAPPITGRSSSSRTPRCRAMVCERSRRAASSPMRAALICACARTSSTRRRRPFARPPTALGEIAR